MLIWGTKETTFKGRKTYPLCCEKCHKWEHVGYARAKYFHLFWVPTYLWAKELGLVCTACGHVTCGGLITQQVRKEVTRTVFSPLRRAPYFIGIPLLIALLAWTGHNDNERARTTRDYLAAPHVNDVYVADLSDYVVIAKGDPCRYGLLCVEGVEEGEVRFKIGKSLSNKASRIKQDMELKATHQPGYFFEPLMSLSMGDLHAMLDNGTIQEIVRPEPEAALATTPPGATAPRP